ncbi:MAG: PEP-CTERM sorting domain-containing protein [Limisphaerales bacterium]
MLQSGFNLLTKASARTFLGLTLAAGSVTFVHAQGQVASGTISGSGTGPYTYNLTFSDAAGATSPIGSIWYAWIPGEFYLPGVPTSASAPAGWTATVLLNSVQYVANSPANYLTAGQSLSGFSYQATFSPAQLAAAPNSGVSVAYSGGLFSDAGQTFTVQVVPVPEPSGSMLLLSGAAVLWFVRRKFQTC